MAHTFNPVTDGTVAIETVLAEEANRIGSDIHKQTLHTSPWIDLIKKSTFPDQSGAFLTTLIYDLAVQFLLRVVLQLLDNRELIGLTFQPLRLLVLLELPHLISHFRLVIQCPLK